MHRRDERGASLMIVMGLMAFLAVLLPAVLGLAFTGARATRPVIEDRRALYAAGAGLDAAIQQGRRADWVGRDAVHGSPCPTQTLVIDGFKVVVDCTSTTLRCHLDRSVSYTAVVTEIDTGEVHGSASADVVFQYGITAGPDASVAVLRWDADPRPVAEPSPSPMAFAHGAGDSPAVGGCEAQPTATTVPPTTVPPTTTTVPPTTTTVPPTTVPPTTTTVPAESLGLTMTLTKEDRSGNSWRAIADVLVTDDSGVPRAGASVTVEIRYRTSTNGPWILASTPTSATDDTGTVRFPSADYKKNSGSGAAQAVQYTVVSVSSPGGTWSGGALTAFIER